MSSGDTHEFLNNLDRAAEPIGFYPMEDSHWNTEQGPRRSGPVEEESTGVLSLVEVDGTIVRWSHHFSEYAITEEVLGPRRGIAGLPTGQIIWEQKYVRLGQNDIGKHLSKIDAQLTPSTGLREWKDGELVESPRFGSEKPILLLIHGTFSNTKNLAEGKLMTDFLQRAQKKYCVLALDHHTISMSPMLNAMDLAAKLRDVNAPIHVICHSRGGLVARWWIEVFSQRQWKASKCILVGCPLNGTSLAAPDRIRHGLDLLGNVAKALGAATSVVPMLTVVTGLLKIIGSAISLSANTPAIDALLSMVPGLASMSRIENNEELIRLRERRPPTGIEYYAISSDFGPEDKSIWEFWKYFTEPVRSADKAANLLVFRDVRTEEPVSNDLVVDTASMTDALGFDSISPSRIMNFEKKDHVYHTNYFEHQQTIDFLSDRLEVE
jgi:pimeloyl-ACP methyl ester carboxylesterase